MNLGLMAILKTPKGIKRIFMRSEYGHLLCDELQLPTLTQLQTLLYLIRRSYAYIYSLIISSEPVSEALLPIFNQLQTLRRCLLEVKRSGGVSSPRELYPYSMKVSSSRLAQAIRREYQMSC